MLKPVGTLAHTKCTRKCLVLVPPCCLQGHSLALSETEEGEDVELEAWDSPGRMLSPCPKPPPQNKTALEPASR
jgi:hypothetical protein